MVTVTALGTRPLLADLGAPDVGEGASFVERMSSASAAIAGTLVVGTLAAGVALDYDRRRRGSWESEHHPRDESHQEQGQGYSREGQG